MNLSVKPMLVDQIMFKNENNNSNWRKFWFYFMSRVWLYPSMSKHPLFWGLGDKLLSSGKPPHRVRLVPTGVSLPVSVWILTKMKQTEPWKSAAHGIEHTCVSTDSLVWSCMFWTHRLNINILLSSPPRPSYSQENQVNIIINDNKNTKLSYK